jgi:hypothetical protein
MNQSAEPSLWLQNYVTGDYTSKDKILHNIPLNIHTDKDCEMIVGKLTVYRGMSRSYIKEWYNTEVVAMTKNTITINPKTITSWTTSPKVAQRFAIDGIIISAKVTQPQVLCDLRKYNKNEQEILLKPGIIKTIIFSNMKEIESSIDDNKEEGDEILLKSNNFIRKLKEHFEFIKKLDGSSEGGLFKDTQTDKLFYIKLYKDPNQAYVGHLANDFYHRMGVKVPKTRVVNINDTIVYISEYIVNQQFNLKILSPGIARKICDDIIYDQFLVNWNVIGSGFSNIIISNSNEVYRINNGGSLMYGPRGDLKKKDDYNKIIVKSFKQLLEFTNYTTFCDIPGHRAKLNKIVSLRNKFGGFENYIKSVLPEVSKELVDNIVSIFEKRLSVIQDAITDCVKLI